MNNNDKTRLEQLIDEYGLSRTLEVMSEICNEKAERIAAFSNGTDKTSEDWQDSGSYIHLASQCHGSIRAVSPK